MPYFKKKTSLENLNKYIFSVKSVTLFSWKSINQNILQPNKD